MKQLDSLKNLVTSKAGRQILTLQKHSPQILFGAGVVGFVATAVLTAKATMKLGDVLEDHKLDMAAIAVAEDRQNIDEEKATQVKAYVFGKTAMRITKLYGPAVLIGGLSIAALTGSHHILTQRNSGLMAAYAAIDKAFGKYRERVQADLGEDKDREFMYGTEERTYVKTNSKGVEKTVTEIKVAEGELSGYAKLWGRDTSELWSVDAGSNILVLRNKQSWLNDKLKAKGHVLLNDVYDDLGLERTAAGCVVGWVYQPEDHTRDNYIDFGVFNKQMQPEHFDFFTGKEDAIWLDFNVDGVVYDLLGN